VGNVHTLHDQTIVMITTLMMTQMLWSKWLLRCLRLSRSRKILVYLATKGKKSFCSDHSSYYCGSLQHLFQRIWYV